MKPDYHNIISKIYLRINTKENLGKVPEYIGNSYRDMKFLVEFTTQTRESIF